MYITPAVQAKINVACLRESPKDLDVLDNLIDTKQTDIASINIRANLYRSVLVQQFLAKKMVSTYVSPIAHLYSTLDRLAAQEDSSSDDWEIMSDDSQSDR